MPLIDNKPNCCLFKTKLFCPVDLQKNAPKNTDEDGNDGSFISGCQDPMLMDNITSQTQQDMLMFATSDEGKHYAGSQLSIKKNLQWTP